MTTNETLKTAKSEMIEKINALPNTIETMNADWETVTADIADGKIELVSIIEAISEFIPAFSPEQNIERAIFKASDSAKLAFNAATNNII
jgi:hypothetical protein